MKLWGLRFFVKSPILWKTLGKHTIALYMCGSCDHNILSCTLSQREGGEEPGNKSSNTDWIPLTDSPQNHALHEKMYCLTGYPLSYVASEFKDRKNPFIGAPLNFLQDRLPASAPQGISMALSWILVQGSKLKKVRVILSCKHPFTIIVTFHGISSNARKLHTIAISMETVGNKGVD